MASSYYSPDAILTDSQKAPCTFELTVPQLTPLNNGSVIDSGTKLELPLWLAEMLAVSKPAGPSSGSLASLDMPAPLGTRVMNALRADPKSVNVRAQAQRFYGLGERMLELFEDDEVAEVLNDVSSCWLLLCKSVSLAELQSDIQTTRDGDCRPSPKHSPCPGH